MSNEVKRWLYQQKNDNNPQGVYKTAVRKAFALFLAPFTVKKIGTILLLLLIFQYTFGLFIVYVWNSVVIRQSMKEAIAAGSFQHRQITTVSVTLQGLTPTETARWQQDEISIKGKMYDVVSARLAGNRLTVKCICDDDENLLTDSYRQAVENGPKNAPGKAAVNLKSISSPFIINHFSVRILQPKENVEPNLLQYQPIVASLQYSNVATPPPRQV